MHMSLALTRSLVRPLTRAIDWTPLAVAVPLTVALIAPLGLLVPDNAPVMQRIAALLLGSAAAFALVDPLDRDTAATPVPRWLRQGLRAGMALMVAASAWAAVCVITTSRMPEEVRPPLSALATEASALIVVGLVGAAFALRHQANRSKALAGGIVQIGYAVAIIPLAGLPPGTAEGNLAHLSQAAALPALLLCLAFASRDVRDERAGHAMIRLLSRARSSRRR